MYSKITALILITSSWSFAASKEAQAPQPTPSPAIGRISLAEVIKKGIEYSPDVQKADGAVKEATGSLDKARGSFFPTLTATASGTNQQKSTTASTASVPGSVSSSTNDTFLAGLTLTQPLYAGGALTSGLSLYKTNEETARQNFYSAKQTLLGSLITAYYSLVQTEMILEAAEANRDILKAYLDITTHYARIGRSRHMDELQAQANYSLSMIDVDKQQSALQSAQANVNRYLGEPKSAPVRSDFRVTVSPIANLTPQEALETAIKNNPTIQADKLKVEAVDYTKGVDLSQDMPSLNFSGTFGYQSPDVPDLWQSSSQYYSAGLTLTVPIFSGLSSFSKRRIYAAQTYEAEKQLQSDKDALRVQIEQALSNIQHTQGQLDISVRSVREARMALDLANKNYRDGTASSTDVINNQNTRYNAEKTFISTQFDYLAALLALRQSMGIDLEKAYGH